MKINYIKHLTVFALSLLSLYSSLEAQTEIKKEVEVVKPYEPVVSDAKKITILPKINDSIGVQPVFQYKVVPIVINNDYQLSSINAAKMLSMPLTKLYNGYLRLGYGNYSTPLAELYLNSNRSKSYSYGALVQHKSSTGNVTLDNDHSVYAGYSDTKAELFGKKFLTNAVLSAKAGFQGKTVYPYGYQWIYPILLDKDSIRQHFIMAGFDAGVHSIHLDSSQLFYKGNFHFNYFKDRFDNAEHNVDVTAQFNKKIDNKMFGVDIDYNFLNRNKTLDPLGNNNAQFNITPWINISSEDYQLKAGLLFVFENQLDEFHIKLYPTAEFNFVAVKDVLLPFLGVYGKVQNHSYSDIAMENPYIRPRLLINNGYNFTFYGGVKGNLADKTSYIAKLEYANITDDYFFINDTLSKYRNQFIIAYDDVKKTTGSLDINYAYSDELSFSAKLNFYQYQMTHQSYAWHKPSNDFTLSARYNMRNKIIVDFNMLTEGARHVKQFRTVKPYNEIESTTLNGMIDFNLGVEYRYTKVLSAWIKFNNFTFSKYYIWNLYTAQRFNMMLGITYSL